MKQILGRKYQNLYLEGCFEEKCHCSCCSVPKKLPVLYSHKLFTPTFWYFYTDISAIYETLCNSANYDRKGAARQTTMTRRNGKAPFEGVRKRGPNCDCKGWLLLTVVNLSRQQSTQSFFLCDRPTTEPCACTRLSVIHWNSVVKLTIASYLVSSPKWLDLPKV